MEHSRLRQLPRPDRDFQTTLSAETERGFRAEQSAAGRIQLRLPLELQREPRHRGHAYLTIPGTAGTRSREKRRPGNRLASEGDSFPGAVSRSDNDRRLSRIVAGDNELVLRSNRAAPASVGHG